MALNEDLLYALIGEQLKRARVNSGIPQSRLADAIGHLRTSISNIEGGRQRPPLHVLYELCYHVGIEVVSILPLDREVRKIPLVGISLGEVTEELPPQAAAAVQEILRVSIRKS